MKNRLLYFCVFSVILGAALVRLALFDNRSTFHDEIRVQNPVSAPVQSSGTRSLKSEAKPARSSGTILREEWAMLRDIKAKYTNMPHLHYIEYMDKHACDANFEEFLELITNDFGEGRTRNKLHESLFASVIKNSGAKAIGEAMVKMDDLPPGVDKDRVRAAILVGISHVGFKDLQTYFREQSNIIEDLIISEEDARYLVSGKKYETLTPHGSSAIALGEYRASGNADSTNRRGMGA